MSFVTTPSADGHNYANVKTPHRKTLMSTMVVLASVLFLLYKYVLQISPSVMVHPLMEEFHLTGMAMGALTASWFWTMLIFQFAAGPMLDRYSAKWVSALAIAIASCGALAFSFSSTLQEAVWARSLMGVGAAFATVSYLKLTADWFSGRGYAVVCGLLATGSMLGSLLAQSPLSILVSHVGWQDALFYCALLGFTCAVLYYLLVPSRSAAANYQTNPQSQQSVRLKDCLTILRSSQNWWLVLYSGLAFTPLAVFGGLWGNTCLEQLHYLSPMQASLMTSCLFVGLGVGGPLFGFFAGKLTSRRNCMYIGLLLTFLGFFAAIYLPVHSPKWVATELLAAGLGTGAFMLGFGVGKDLNPLRYAASVICMINTGDALLGALTEPLVGRLLDLTTKTAQIHETAAFSTHSYHLSMAILLVFVGLAALCVTRLKRVD